MFKFIQAPSVTGEDVFLNVDQIVAFYHTTDGISVHMTSGDEFMLRATISQIQATLAQMKKDLQKEGLK